MSADLVAPSEEAALPAVVAVPAKGVDNAAPRRHPLLDTSRPLGRAVRLFLTGGGIATLMGLGVPLCPFAIVTRHPCPGCGLTRATIALLHGDLHGAAHMHPLVFVVTPVIAVAFTYNAYHYVRHGKWFASEGLNGRWVTGAWIALGVAMVALWIARFLGAFGGPVPV